MNRFSNRTMRRRGLRDGRGVLDRLIDELWTGRAITASEEAMLGVRAEQMMEECVAKVRVEGAPEFALRQYFGSLALGFSERQSELAALVPANLPGPPRMQ